MVEQATQIKSTARLTNGEYPVNNLAYLAIKSVDIYIEIKKEIFKII